jgi:hypothetical protein
MTIGWRLLFDEFLVTISGKIGWAHNATRIPLDSDKDMRGAADDRTEEANDRLQGRRPPVKGLAKQAFRKWKRTRVVGTAFLCWLIYFEVSDAKININVDAVENSVVFLYSADSNGTADKDRPLGTGFMLQVGHKSDPKHVYLFILTARHIIDPVWAKCNRPNPDLIYARVNKDPGVEFIPIKLFTDGNYRWFHSSEGDIDAAIISVLPDEWPPEQWNESVPKGLSAIKITDFPTEEEVSRQSIGDQIVSAGLLPALQRTSRNYPIFKFGQISNIPREDVETRCSPQSPAFFVKVWLVAANLVPGNSGSPIFSVPFGANGIIIGGTRPMLLGIQSVSFIGADVAGVTPISDVYHIIEQLNLPDADLQRGPPKPAATPPRPEAPK